MKYQKLDLVQGTPEWKAARLTHLTASQAPVLFGLSPYQTRLGLFEEKVTGEEMPIDDFRLRLFAKGREAELASRVYVEKLLGVRFETPTLVSVPYPDLLASLDGHSEKDNLIMEAKYMGKANLEAARSGVVQSHHLCQVQAQLLVSGAEKCVYFATSENGESAMVDIYPDPAYHEEIARGASQFMKDVREGKAPEPSDKDYYLPENDARFDELARAKLILDDADLAYEKIKSDLLKAYEKHRRVRFGEVTIVRSFRKGNVNYSKIPQLKGLDLDRFRGPSTEVATVKIGKGKRS